MDDLNVDAVSYLAKVRQALLPPEYSTFLTIMTRFKTSEASTHETILAVRSLFREHPELAEGFQGFLPPGGDSIESLEAPSSKDSFVTPQPTSQDVALQQALEYIRSAKETLDPEAFQAFLAILQTRLSLGTAPEEIHAQLSVLLAEHPELRQGLRAFLPLHYRGFLQDEEDHDKDNNPEIDNLMESDRTAISDDDVTVIWMGKKASPSEKTDDSRGSVQPSVPEQPLCLTSPLNNADDENTPLLPLAHESSLVLEESTRRQRASRLSVWLWFSLSVLGWIAVLGTVIGYIIFWWVTGSQV